MPRYHRKSLFDERPDALLHVGPFEQRNEAPQGDARAAWNVSEVGVRQPRGPRTRESADVGAR
ncbi:MAG: hypothetical protein IPQ17_05600 [Xanthomonadales bacterium]|nr:hypothetical protein [Xanthomonadales bacterium]